MQNTTYVLTEAQTGEFRNIWDGHRSRLKPQDFNFVWMKLNRKQAILTKNQVFRIAITLTETGYPKQLPEWLLTMIDPTEPTK